MTQAKLDLQNQLEQHNETDLTNQPLFNDSPVLFLEVMDQAPSLGLQTQDEVLLNKLNIHFLQKNIVHLQKQIIMTNLI